MVWLYPKPSDLIATSGVGTRCLFVFPVLHPLRTCPLLENSFCLRLTLFQLGPLYAERNAASMLGDLLEQCIEGDIHSVEFYHDCVTYLTVSIFLIEP